MIISNTKISSRIKNMIFIIVSLYNVTNMRARGGGATLL
jgi:hypothetical protein